MAGSIEKDYGDNNFTNLASAQGSVAISYHSSDDTVASVDATTGEVTIHAVGEVQ